MTIDTYEIALEHYVKSYVNSKALDTIKANGNYDKAIMRFVMEFTRMSSPKKVWGVSRAELIEDMKFIVEHVTTANAIRIEGKAFAFRSQSGYLRILYADSVDEYVSKLDEIPNKMRSDFEPMDYFIELEKVGGNSALTVDGTELEYDYRIFDTVINGLDRMTIFKQTEVIQ